MYPELLNYSESLDLGETIREICPECESLERSLSITRLHNGVVVYQCFRASCNLEPGCIRSTAVPLVKTNKSRKKNNKQWNGRTRPIPRPVQKWILREWGIEDTDGWFYTDDYNGRIAMPLISAKGRWVGWCLRGDGSHNPKSLTFVKDGEQGTHWNLTQPFVGTIIVEDMASARRAAKYLNSIALLGTGIGQDRAIEIGEYAPRPIIMALDNDATDLSFKWARKYSLLWGDVTVLPLQKDLKNMQEDELCELLEAWRINSVQPSRK